MNKKMFSALILAMTLLFPVLVSCTDSSQQSVVIETNYDPVAEVARFELNDLSEKEENHTIRVGYNNCDHMVASIIAEEAGINEALGLSVELTQTGQIAEAMASGEMDVGYQGLSGAVRAANEGAPLFMAAANHLGGSRYLVVSNDIESPEDLVGKNLAISAKSDVSPEWIRWANELEIPVDVSNYNVVEMGQADANFALNAGQIDGFVC